MPGFPNIDIFWFTVAHGSGKLKVVRSAHSSRRALFGSLWRQPQSTVALIAPIETPDTNVRSDSVVQQAFDDAQFECPQRAAPL